MSKIKEYKVKRKDRREYNKRTNKELKELAVGCYRGDVFTSFQVHNSQDLGMVFMPLMMMNPVQRKDMAEDRPHMYYSFMKQQVAPQSHLRKWRKHHRLMYAGGDGSNISFMKVILTRIIC